MAWYGPHGSKYNPETVKKITDAIAAGAHRSHAAGYAGISYQTLLKWEKTHPAFVAEMEMAAGRAVVGWMAKIEKSLNEGDWRAGAWKLEHIHPEIYGRTVQDTRHTGADGESVIRLVIDRAGASET